MKTHHVLEYSSPAIRGNIIKGVKIVGTHSANGRKYPAEVLQKAVPLYESAPVFVCHPDPREKRQGSRVLRDHFGNLENVSGNGNGLFGDLKVKPTHPLARAVLEAAPSASFGLSHNAVLEMNADETEVTSIVEVKSVDLVDDPATTKNLFEEKGMEGDNQQAPLGATIHEKRIVALEAAIIELTQAIEVLEGKNKGGSTKRLTALEDKTDDDEGEATPIGNNHDDFLDVVRGFALK